MSKELKLFNNYIDNYFTRYKDNTIIGSDDIIYIPDEMELFYKNIIKLSANRLIINQWFMYEDGQFNLTINSYYKFTDKDGKKIYYVNLKVKENGKTRYYTITKIPTKKSFIYHVFDTIKSLQFYDSTLKDYI